ncbi:MAG: IS4 family transposase [Polyangiaceae bacterium]|nr:IS4 family transposase [Polyangiaceae bacterium]
MQEFTGEVFGESMHAARLRSLGNGVVGVVNAAVLAIHAIGQAYARCARIMPRSGVKQIDRLLSNDGLAMDALLRTWVRFIVGNRPEVVLAMDWTVFDADSHSTLAVYAVTNHGRATPLAWRTFHKSKLKGNQKQYEFEMVERIHEWLDPSQRVTLLADRGFGDQKLYDFLGFLGWDYVIRFRGEIQVTSEHGVVHMAHDWVPPSGRATMLKNARVTANGFEVPAVVVVWDKKMKEPWCLATSLSTYTAGQITKKYGRRFTIEETFRDQKDLHFGMGLKATHIRSAERRDRLLLLAAVAHVLLTLLGAAAERCGMDRYLKVNTVSYRTHSLYRQGLYWYEAIPDMRKDWLVPLMKAFDQVVREHAQLCEIIGVL